MERKQIYIVSEQEEQLKHLAKEERTTVSALIRDAVAVYLVERLTPELKEPEEHPYWESSASLTMRMHPRMVPSPMIVTSR